MSVVRPSVVPRWAATTATQAAGTINVITDPTSGVDNAVQPSGGQMDSGYVALNCKPTRQSMNWMLWNLSQWCAYLGQFVDQDVRSGASPTFGTLAATALNTASLTAANTYATIIRGTQSLKNGSTPTGSIDPSVGRMNMQILSIQEVDFTGDADKLNTLVGGSSSDADTLHTHATALNTASLTAANTYATIIRGTQSLKNGSTPTGSIDPSVGRMDMQILSIQEVDFTGDADKLNTLVGGSSSDATSLHTHGGISTLLLGNYASLYAQNLGTPVSYSLNNIADTGITGFVGNGASHGLIPVFGSNKITLPLSGVFKVSVALAFSAAPTGNLYCGFSIGGAAVVYPNSDRVYMLIPTGVFSFSSEAILSGSAGDLGFTLRAIGAVTQTCSIKDMLVTVAQIGGF